MEKHSLKPEINTGVWCDDLGQKASTCAVRVCDHTGEDRMERR